MGVAGLFAVMTPLAAQSQQSRCAMPGHLALSAHMGFLAGAAGGDRERLVEETISARHLIGYHRDLGCPMAALHEAMECVNVVVRVTENMNKPLLEIANGCMKRAGMPNR